MIPDTLEEICRLFDCAVIDDTTEDLEEVYYLGDPGDWTCHERGYQLTPLFRSREELEEYCQTDEGKEEISERAGGVWYEWNVEAQEWEE